MIKYGLQFAPISREIHIGRINKAGNQFLDKENKTQEFIRAAIQMWGGYETEIIDKSTGKTWKVIFEERDRL